VFRRNFLPAFSGYCEDGTRLHGTVINKANCELYTFKLLFEIRYKSNVNI
jgi:hypothetical protein